MEPQDRIMDGDLQTLGLQSILKMLALSGKTGTLLVHSGPETLVISLRRGQLVALHEEGVPQPDLLGMLCLINRLDLPRAQALRDASQGNLQIALSLMVEQGWMTAGEMQQRLEFAVTQSISHALRWVDGRFAFHRQMVTMESKMQPLDVDSMLLEALRQADEWEELGETSLTRTTVSRWLPEVSKDVRNLGLNQEHIDVLCLSNGEIPLQGMSLALMVPEARVAHMMLKLLELRLVEMVDTSLEAELQQDLSNIIIMCQHTLAQQRQNNSPVQHLLGLINTLGQCTNGLLIHHGTFAKSLRGRGQLPVTEIVRYLERRFSRSLQMLAKQQYPILETAIFSNGQLDYSEIIGLDSLVKGEQLEEFYWEAVLGLAAFLRTVFAALLQDEVGNSHTGRQLNIVWKAFMTEVEQEIQQYQLYRAHQNVQQNRTRRTDALETGQNWNMRNEGNLQWSPETQRRLI